MPHDHAELRERVQAAEGPDRELDAEMWFLLAAQAVGPVTEGFEDYGGVRRTHWTKGSIGIWDDEIPKYTASIDAALALVEAKLPGWTTDIHTADASLETYPVRCHLHQWSDKCSAEICYHHPALEPREIGEGWGPTLPIAILDALLTALIDGAPHTTEPRHG